jgi:hypothetical protein
LGRSNPEQSGGYRPKRYRILWLFGRGPVTHVQALDAKGLRDRLARFANPPVWGHRIVARGRTADAIVMIGGVVKKADENAVSQNKLVLRPLIGLMRGQAPEEIEHFVIEEIKKHRRLRDEAVGLEIALEASPQECDQISARRAYITAMIAMHAQQTVVSTLLDILGYIPDGVAESVH